MRGRFSARLAFTSPFVVAMMGAAILVALVGLLPVAYVWIRATESLNLLSSLADPAVLRLLATTLLLAAAVTAACVLIGVPAALLSSADLPGRRVFEVLFTLPLAVPSYVGALTVIASLGQGGLLQEVVGAKTWPDIYGFFGAWLVLTTFSFPYVLLTVRGAVQRLDPSLVEAARLHGRSPWTTVVVPILTPGAVSGALLVALYTLSDFGAVSLMRCDTFTRVIYTRYMSTLDRGGAAFLSLVLVFLTVAVLVVEGLWRRRSVRYQPRVSTSPRPFRIRLGRFRMPALIAALLLSGLSVGTPILTLGVWLARGGGGGFSGSWLTHSLSLGLGAAVLAVAAAVPVAFARVRSTGMLWVWVNQLTYVGFALPGIVVGLGLVFFAARAAPAIYQTVPLLLLAYVIRFVPQAVGAAGSALALVPVRLEEAARSLGSGPGRAFRKVTLPRIASGLVGGAALVFLTTVKELPATMLLAPPDFDTLATEIWHNTEEAFFGRAALPALILVALAAAPMLFGSGKARV